MAYRVNAFKRLRVERRELLPLKIIAREKICKDIGRHSIRYHTVEDKTLYTMLHREEADNILDIVRETFPRVTDGDETWIFLNICREWGEVHIQNFFNFLFNKFARRVELSGKDFNEYSVLALSQNCEDLDNIRIFGTVLQPRLCTTLFSSIRQLTVLTLMACEKLTSETMEVIATSLTLLRSLNLSNTVTGDNAIYVLCGHKLPVKDSSNSSCCYTKQCEVVSPLKLQDINVACTEVSEAGVACLLTHIPTLKRIILTDDWNSSPFYCRGFYSTPFPTPEPTPGSLTFTLESIISNINTLRENHGLPSLTFQLE